MSGTTPWRLRILRLNSRHVAPRSARLADVIALTVWGPWQCRIVGHELVPQIPLCWRCQREWNSWAEVK